MMTCKDCIHYDVCWNIKEISFGNPMIQTESLCESFKAKSDFVEFPLKVGNMTILRENGKIVGDSTGFGYFGGAKSEKA